MDRDRDAGKPDRSGADSVSWNEPHAEPGSVLHPKRCPYLGLRADPDSLFLLPTEEHRCYAEGSGREIDPKYQAFFCLTGIHVGCLRLAAAQAAQQTSSPRASQSPGEPAEHGPGLPHDSHRWLRAGIPRVVQVPLHTLWTTLGTLKRLYLSARHV